MAKKVICLIPARLGSTRFPRKILAEIAGKTILEHVYLAAQKCPEFSDIIIAVDSEETAGVIRRFGGNYCNTCPTHPTGTSRLIEVMRRMHSDADIWVNWQADEPFILPSMIKNLLQGIEDKGLIWTLKKEIHSEEELKNPSVVKVVTDRENRALYFSRSSIPFNRTNALLPIYKHIGLYAYSAEALSKIAALAPSPLAEAESLEQLAFLEHGLPIHVYPTEYETIGIDTQEDLARAIIFYSQNTLSMLA